MRNLLLLLFFGVATATFAQKKPDAVKITYERTSNGKYVEGQDPTIIIASAEKTEIVSAAILAKKAPFPYEYSLLDRRSGHYNMVAQLSAGQAVITIDSVEISKQNFTLASDTKKILGYTCKRASTVINSNKIDVWYTDALPFKGSPTTLGQNLGLVLQIERNGNFAITATKFEILKTKHSPIVHLPQGKPVDLLTYRDLLWKSRFITLPIFANEIINYTDEVKKAGDVHRFAKGTVIARKIKFPTIPPGHRIFVDAVHKSKGDAYDRTGSIFMIPDSEISFLQALQNSPALLPLYENGNGKKYQGVTRMASYVPPVELMRFFTPFGISHYNTIKIKNRTWQDSITYRQDITELATQLSGKEVWIGAGISNYDKGGHRFSANITIHEDRAKEVYDVCLPLFQTHNVMEAAGQEYPTMFDHQNGLLVEFELEKEVKNAVLRYIGTGHGGWENGDEFVQKSHTILLNGKEVHTFIPWRVDCGSYRDYNPASGNFPNGLSSSDYSRSNWCPGMVTNPHFISLGNLPAGKHRIQIRIPQGAPEGGSFSAWAVSGVLLGTH